MTLKFVSDSSLLLSPKADIPMPVSGGSNEVYSQEVPNFLSGMFWFFTPIHCLNNNSGIAIYLIKLWHYLIV